MLMTASLQASSVGLTVTGGEQLGERTDPITITGGSGTTGILVEGESATGVDSYIEKYTGTIDVEALNGSAVGINIQQGSIGSLEGATINVLADEDGSSTGTASVEGLILGAQGTVGNLNNLTVNVEIGGDKATATGIEFTDVTTLPSYRTDVETEPLTYFMQNAMVTVTGKGGKLNFVSGAISPTEAQNVNLGVISGTFVMNSNNETDTFKGDLSVGYLIGSDAGTTSASVGFVNTHTDSAVQNSSAGYIIDWENTSMQVNRVFGLSGGAAVFGRQDDLKDTILGAGSYIESTIVDGMSVAAWLNGVDISLGALLGTTKASAGAGVAVGLSTSGTDLIATYIADQSDLNSIAGDISGHVSAVLHSDAASEVYGESTASMSVGYLAASIKVVGEVTTHFKTDMTGEFSGEISAQLDDISSADGTLRDGTLVAGIVNYGTIDQSMADALWGTGENATSGSDLLSFEGNAFVPEGTSSAGNDDVAGTSVTALIYDSTGVDTKEAVAFGQAIMSIVGDTELTTTSTGAANTTRIVGDITTGTGTTGGVTPGAESLSFQEGHFTVTSSNWNAGEAINFGKFDPDTVEGIMTTTVQLSSMFEIDSNATRADGLGEHIALNTSTLNFAGVNETNVSQLIAGDGMSLTLNGLDTVNVELAESVDYYKDYFAAGGGPIFFLDARKADYFDTEQVNYNLTIGGVDVPHYLTDNFRLYHDENGIYLYDKVYRIPEPSTATLSLLALAGMLARRRRRRC